MNRWDIINKLIKKYNYKTYLEIGIYTGECFNKIQCEFKAGVDPNPAFSSPWIFKSTSDKYFDILNPETKFDIIFIDGLHHTEQVDRDIENSLKHLSENGRIVIHDCNPPTYQHASREPILNEWNGDVYKSIIRLRENRGDLKIVTVDIDWGCAIIKKEKSSRIKVESKIYTCWPCFADNRKHALGLISVQEFLNTEFPIVKNILPNNLFLLSAQPDSNYFAWQLEVQFLNFRRLNIPLNQYHVLIGFEKQVSNTFLELSKRYPDVKWGFYEDTRKNKRYIPSIRPHIISKHFKFNRELESQNIFYLDCDVIFQKLPDFTSLLQNDIWYLSDTNSYINADYIKSKGDKILEDMCRVVGVSVESVEKINNNSGGAQYLLKNIDYKFWEKVERDCTNLFIYMVDSKPFHAKEFAKKTNQLESQYHEIQAWCADMWAVLWGGIYLNRQVQITSELSFSWATSSAHQWFTNNIYHNAGVTGESSQKLFYKGAYVNGLPDNLDLSYISDSTASYYYAQYIKELLSLQKKP